MSGRKRRKKVFKTLRELPLEVSFAQVEQWVKQSSFQNWNSKEDWIKYLTNRHLWN